jgi:SAM-dependent methyltransferase
MLRLILVLIGNLALAAPALAQVDSGKDNIAGPYVPTPWEIVHEMLKLGDVGSGDVVYDLGSGDGRLVITAAKRHGANGVGIELDPALVETAREGAVRERVQDRVKFVAGDLFDADVSGASVVTLYLLPRFVTRLVPKLRAELAPGARIVSHDYPLSPWPPDKTLVFDVAEKEAISGSARTTLYYYVVPARVAGRWSVALPKALGAGSLTLRLNQEPDQLEGVAQIGGDTLTVRDLVVRADSIRFWLFHRGRLIRFQGTVAGNEMSGEVRSQNVVERWTGRLVGTTR